MTSSRHAGVAATGSAHESQETVSDAQTVAMGSFSEWGAGAPVSCFVRTSSFQEVAVERPSGAHAALKGPVCLEAGFAGGAPGVGELGRHAATKLSDAPGKIGPADLEPLRAVGLTDPEIHDAVQVISYFNYINRNADALGTDLEPGLPAKPEGWSKP